MVVGDIGTFEWNFVADRTREVGVTAGVDLFAFEGDMVVLKNAFRKGPNLILYLVNI